MAESMTDLLGKLLQSGLKGPTAERINHSLGEDGMGGSGGLLEQIFGKEAAEQVSQARPQSRSSQPSRPASKPAPAPSGAESPFDALSKIATSVLTKAKEDKSLAAGGLGALVGSILGGGSSSVKGAVGGGALALLGSLALQALQNAGVKQADELAIDPQAKLTAGLRDPENEQEERQVQSVAELTLKAMINAAKADGQIDQRELDRIVGKAEENGVTPQEREFISKELRKPVDIDSITRNIPNQQVGAQIYAASLLAIEVDTPAEKQYLRDLATKLRLDGSVVKQLHGILGVAA